eukprot:4609241-Pyramimonas_sp.AAC.1
MQNSGDVAWSNGKGGVWHVVVGCALDVVVSDGGVVVEVVGDASFRGIPCRAVAAVSAGAMGPFVCPGPDAKSRSIAYLSCSENVFRELFIDLSFCLARGMPGVGRGVVGPRRGLNAYLTTAC